MVVAICAAPLAIARGTDPVVVARADAADAYALVGAAGRASLLVARTTNPAGQARTLRARAMPMHTTDGARVRLVAV